MTPDKREAAFWAYEAKAGDWLARGNAANERGDKALAERHYDRAQKWLDKATEARGWA